MKIVEINGKINVVLENKEDLEKLNELLQADENDFNELTKDRKRINLKTADKVSE